MNNVHMVEKVAKRFDELFASRNVLDWGGKGYLVDRVSKEIGASKAQVARIHAVWAASK